MNLAWRDKVFEILRIRRKISLLPAVVARNTRG
jgi:hypothetical protein